ncbi:hypothetical protein GF1_11920 [Desulfolithobacter dissulfuricans]|uniref:DUF2523 domain-containing protein n=1 Tax=Desulfolithobacter dissulfuricans TaxID=2795293 RepID=A0A915XKW9_9BACT|nr:DUF2523 family protein [Desulfolithobacter dissulfuricans]BCO08816.1 hypothetical protein GF1_11920 [Desulfolithobacter dissulfuricans]
MLDWLKDFINSFWDLLVSILSWLLDAVFLVISFVGYTIYDGFLMVVQAFFATLDFSSVAFTHAAEWSSLPPQLIWLINQLALPQCITIVSSAILLRVLLNLVPAALTRV